MCTTSSAMAWLTRRRSAASCRTPTRTGTAAGPPRYVLLVGDGHYDFKNVTGTPQLNLIPPYLIPIDPWIGETAADNRYVSVDGTADFMPDMAIGRIPRRVRRT